MIRKVTKHGTTWADVPARFEAGTPAIAQAIGLAAALRWLDGIGMEHVTAHEQEIAAYAMECLAEVPGLTIFGPPPSPEMEPDREHEGRDEKGEGERGVERDAHHAFPSAGRRLSRTPSERRIRVTASRW